MNIPLIQPRGGNPMAVDYQPGPLADLMHAAIVSPNGTLFRCTGGQLRDVENAVQLLAAHIRTDHMGLTSIGNNEINMALDIAHKLHAVAWGRLGAEEQARQQQGQ